LHWGDAKEIVLAIAEGAEQDLSRVGLEVKIGDEKRDQRPRRHAPEREGDPLEKLRFRFRAKVKFSEVFLAGHSHNHLLHFFEI